MIHEEICTYELCKLAKGKGFNEKCYHYYQNGVLESDGCFNHYNKGIDSICSAPTQSLLQRWLREEKNIHISIIANREEDDDFIWYSNEVLKDTGWSVCSWWERPMTVCYSSYEQALEHALKYALENLV